MHVLRSIRLVGAIGKFVSPRWIRVHEAWVRHYL